VKLKAVIHKAPVILSGVLIGILMATRAFATIYYVSTSGNNQTGDGSTTRPWATLSFACSRLNAFGDTIHVNAGSYTDNTQCVLARGVKIAGDSRNTVTINTAANPYVLASSGVPTVDGSNEISGITFTGNNTNTAITSAGRNNQKIHDNHFLNCAEGILLYGIMPRYINPADGSETGTAISAGPNKLFSVNPAATDWAIGVEIYNNTAVNSQFKFHTIQGAKIHHNIVNNAAALRNAFGATSYFWSGVQFYNNEWHLFRNDQTNIGLEVWHIDNDSKFYNNIGDGWWSLLTNIGGIDTPYSFEVYDNDISSNVTAGDAHQALEIGYHLSKVRVSGNYFSNTGANKTYNRQIAIHGSGPMSQYTITNNVFYNNDGPAIEIDATNTTPGAIINPANIDNMFIYNNVFDIMQGGASSGVLLSNNGSSGDLDGVFVRNNIFMNVAYGVNFYPAPVTMSGNFYDHNTISNAIGNVNSTGSSTFTIGTTYSFAPGILASGDRWKNYYLPNGPNSNLVDRGTVVGLPYLGAAPDIGPYEYAVLAPPAPPDGLTVIAP